MIKNYIKTSVRFFLRNRMFSIINILGLALGMCVFIIVTLWIIDERSYDNFHKNKDQIYRVIVDKVEEGTKKQTVRTPPALSPALKQDYPEIVESTRYFSDEMRLINENRKYLSRGAFVDPSFLKIFSFEFVKGDKNHALDDLLSIVITEDLALKLFGKTDVIGENVKYEDYYVFTVTGVLENIPSNSHLKFDYLLPFEVLYDFGLPKRIWFEINQQLITYIQVNPDVSEIQLEDQVKGIIKRNNTEFNAEILLQPLKDVYLNSNFIGDFEGLGNVNHVRIISFIAIIILIIACLNFMNLSTAQSTKRSKEVGLRKVVGANKRQLIWQFIGEALLIAIIAHFFAMILIELFIPVFNSIAGKNLIIPYSNFFFYIGLSVLILFTGFFAGSYPAFLLSKVKVAKVFKGQFFSTNKGNNFRKILVVIQFSASIALITGALLVNKQFNYLQQKNLGFNKKDVLYFLVRDEENSYKLIKDKILKFPDVESVTVASHVLNDVSHYITVDWEGKRQDERTRLNCIFVDHDLVKTLGMKMIKGRDFDKTNPRDTAEAFIINEKLASLMGYDNPVGKKFSLLGRDGKVIGVVKNFHFKPLQYEIEPMVLTVIPDERFYCYVKLNGLNNQKTIQNIKTEYEKIFQGEEFQYYFLDDTLSNLYKNEAQLKRLVSIFTIFIVLISIMGLFGLATFITSSNTKQVSIRKVLGASEFRAVEFFINNILKLIFVSNIIGLPVAYFMINNWLNNFAYKTDIDIWSFIISSFIAFILAIITISYQTLKVARTNPAKILQYE